MIGGRKGYAGDYGPAIEAWLDTPGGIGGRAERRHLLRRLEQRRHPPHRRAQHIIEPVAGNHDLGTGFSGDNGPAIEAQLDTPDGVAIAPDGDLIVADSHNDRIRRVDRPTGIITTIAGSGENGYDGDDKPATEAALNTPSAVAAAPNGDIYIADTLNYRVRMIDAKTGLIHTVAGDGTPGDAQDVGDGGPATSAHLNMPSDVAIAPQRRHLHRRHAPQPRPQGRREDAHHHDRRRQRRLGQLAATTARRPQARLAGPAGIAVVPEPGGKVDDLHRRLLQRARARRRTRRHHPRRERRRARGVRRADARRVRAAPRLALRRRFEPATASCR